MRIFCNAKALQDKYVYFDFFEQSDLYDRYKKERISVLRSEIFKTTKLGFRTAQTISHHQAKQSRCVRKLIHVMYIKQVKFQLLQSFYVRLC